MPGWGTSPQPPVLGVALGGHDNGPGRQRAAAVASPTCPPGFAVSVRF
jgi:hypothetical protein